MSYLIEATVRHLEERDYEAAYSSWAEVPTEVSGSLNLDWGVDTTIRDLWNGWATDSDRKAVIGVLRQKGGSDE